MSGDESANNSPCDFSEGGGPRFLANAQRQGDLQADGRSAGSSAAFAPHNSVFEPIFLKGRLCGANWLTPWFFYTDVSPLCAGSC